MMLHQSWSPFGCHNKKAAATLSQKTSFIGTMAILKITTETPGIVPQLRKNNNMMPIPVLDHHV